MDLEQVIKLNILGTVPERANEFKSLWGKYSPDVVLSIDKPGYDIHAEYGLRLSFNQRTFHQIWLLGFASWSAFVTYCAPIYLSKINSIPLDISLLEHNDQKESEQAYVNIISEVEKLSSVNFIEDYKWSKKIPSPKNIDFNNNQQKATFDTTAMASAFILLHEIRHIQISKENYKFDNHKEELDCDYYAKNFILEKVEEYSTSTRSNSLDVLSKRATSLAVVVHLFLAKVPLQNWNGTDSHPPLSDRISPFVNDIEQPDNDFYWLYLSSILLAQLRINNISLELTTIHNYKELSQILFQYIIE